MAQDTSATSDDKLWAALAYALPVLIPIVILIQDDKKNRPFIKEHTVQALVYGVVVLGILGSILSTVLFFCLGLPWFVLYGISLFWAYKAYQGESVTIPVITDFVKNQGWA